MYEHRIGLIISNDLTNLFACMLSFFYLMFIKYTYVTDNKVFTKFENKLSKVLLFLGIITVMANADFKDKNLDIFASMNTAKEVGGDFYDFFVIDDDRIAVIIADVSDKGVPAALYMAIGKALIAKSLMEEQELSKVLSSVHKVILNNNSNGMFITLLA